MDDFRDFDGQQPNPSPCTMQNCDIHNPQLPLTEEADARLEALLDAERAPDREAPTTLTFTSPWVRRAQADDLPTFATHQGADAYNARQSDANPFDVYPDY